VASPGDPQVREFLSDGTQLRDDPSPVISTRARVILIFRHTGIRWPYR
jgi:hypothetical protein